MKVYAQSEEKFLKSVVMYGDNDDGNLFADAAKSVKVTKDEVFNLYQKGMLVVFYNNEYFRPVSYKESSGAALVTVVSDTGNLSFYSKEHVAG